MSDIQNCNDAQSAKVAVCSAKVDRFVLSGLGAGSEHKRVISFRSKEYRESRFRIKLYRFMADSIPLISSVIWTWSRLAAAPGCFSFYNDNNNQVENNEAATIIKNLFARIIRQNFGHDGSEDEILPPYFQSLFLDGAVAGKLELYKDLSGIETFGFFDLGQSEIKISSSGEVKIITSDEFGEKNYSGRDIFFYAHNSDLSNPHGRSILKPISFVAYVEQQMVEDMRRSMHNSGYHRLHVKIKPPEKREDENDKSYIQRANGYFDDTVSMIRDIEVEDNPVTWDDVNIEYIGPKGQGSARVNNWYLTHRAMIEEVCSGTNLAPFILGYSYNSTSNWAQLKYDLVMRQVYSVQHAARNFMQWLANIELALKGFKLRAEWNFDNKFSAMAKEQTEIKSREAQYIIDLYNAGLIDKEAAARRAKGLI